jgi:hypothetical protein
LENKKEKSPNRAWERTGKNGRGKKESNVERLLLLRTKKMDVETEWRNIGPGKNVVRTPENRKKDPHKER